LSSQEETPENRQGATIAAEARFLKG